MGILKGSLTNYSLANKVIRKNQEAGRRIDDSSATKQSDCHPGTVDEHGVVARACAPVFACRLYSFA